MVCSCCHDFEKPAESSWATRRLADRQFTVLEDDRFLISYPKSGNRWLRFLLANLLCPDGQQVRLANLDQHVPDVYRHTDEELLARDRPRFMKTHEYLDPRYRRLVYVARDPRDVAVSYHHHLIKVGTLEEGTAFDRFMEGFLNVEFHARFAT